jgi:hypothetical protein
MSLLEKKLVTLFVDRSIQQWIVRDPDGNFRILPSVEDPWDHRQPFNLTADMELEPVSRHYKDMCKQRLKTVVYIARHRLPNDALAAPAGFTTWSADVWLTPDIFPIRRYPQFDDVLNPSGQFLFAIVY